MDINDKAHEEKGRAKEALGDLADDPNLQEEGQDDQAKANVSQKIADVRDKIDTTMDSIRDKVKRS